MGVKSGLEQIRDETRVLITRVISRVISQINTRVISCKTRVFLSN